MVKLIYSLIILLPCSLFAQDSLQLTPPLVKFKSIFFSKKMQVVLAFAHPNTVIHYTLNQEEPTIADPVYKKPIWVRDNLTTIRAKVFGNGYVASDVATATFIKEGKKISTIHQTEPNPKYAAAGPLALFDLKGGNVDIGTNTWLGYNCDTVKIQLTLSKSERVGKVLFNFLQNENAWIFLPEEISIQWYNKELDTYQFFGKELIETRAQVNGANCNYKMVNAMNNVITNKLLINVIVKKQIPDWHPAKGSHAWMFIDEIKVY
ncbi:MAG: FN3 associated domain-containing protein [Sediminibacterium sp.]|uniref:FN3 associated domain-containing protein n=1 Tax=Sediminibacterium sp. TaxID=1917865 RepID=UPI0027219826|nr:FN3 associated domain-containing protein [Sediminibacterium sp.]MDO8996901.1 FN3 associated domain-containing protein [Sediminibacterium sp.]